MRVFSTQPIEEPDRLADVAAFISLFDGEDNVVFASDWPHSDFDHPLQLLKIPLPDEVRAKILGGNAARVLGLEVPV